jgi:hypothetical protein
MENSNNRHLIETWREMQHCGHLQVDQTMTGNVPHLVNWMPLHMFLFGTLFKDINISSVHLIQSWQ